MASRYRYAGMNGAGDRPKAVGDAWPGAKDALVGDSDDVPFADRADFAPSGSLGVDAFLPARFAARRYPKRKIAVPAASSTKGSRISCSPSLLY